MNSLTNKNTVIDGLGKLEEIANKEGISCKELTKQVQIVRDIVFENLVQRGAMMEFLKEWSQAVRSRFFIRNVPCHIRKRRERGKIIQL